MATGFAQRFKGKIACVWGGIWQNGTQSSALFHNAGAPSNGTNGTLAGIAGKGAILADTTNGVLYQNTGSLSSPTWTVIEASTGTLPVTAKGTLGSGTGTFGLSGDINVQNSAAGVGNTNDTTEDTLFTYSLPASSLDTTGRALFITAFGSFANNSHSKHARLYFGSEVIDSGANTTTGGIGWVLEMTVLKTGSSTQIISSQTVAGTVHGGCTTQAGAETDTSAITIKVTGQTGTAAANDILCNGLVVGAAN
jgi:hypothetical protein